MLGENSSVNTFKIMRKSLLLFLFFGFTFTLFSQKQKSLSDQKIIEANSYINTPHSHKTEEICRQLLDTTTNYNTKMKSLILLGQYYNTLAQIDSAITYATKAQNLSSSKAGRLHDRRRARIYNILAIAYNQKGLLDTAASWHIKGIAISEESNDVQFLYMHKHGLANIYRLQKKYKDALELFNFCLQKEGDPQLLYACHINIGLILNEQQKLTEANTHFNKAYTMCVEANDYKCQAIVTINLADNYLNEGNYAKAYNHYLEAKEKAKKNYIERLVLISNKGLAEVHFKTGNLEQAKLILVQSLYSAQQKGYLNIQQELLNILVNIGEKQQDFKHLYRWEKLRGTIIDSLYRLQKAKEIHSLKVNYETLEKEKEIVLLTKSKELQAQKLHDEERYNNLMSISFILILIPIVLSLFIYFQKNKTQSLLNQQLKKRNEQRITNLLRDNEIELLKASERGQTIERKRIAKDLHDRIGGNLASIKHQLTQNEQIAKAIITQLDETYAEVREISHNLTPKKFHQQEFISLIKDYLQSFAKAADIQVEIYTFGDEAINSLNYEIQHDLFSILQELLTNIIKHAQANTIHLELNLLDNRLSVMLEDDGIGMDTHTYKGIGLANIKNRLQNYSGIFHIDSQLKRGTIISIEVPQIESFFRV